MGTMESVYLLLMISGSMSLRPGGGCTVPILNGAPPTFKLTTISNSTRTMTAPQVTVFAILIALGSSPTGVGANKSPKVRSKKP